MERLLQRPLKLRFGELFSSQVEELAYAIPELHERRTFVEAHHPDDVADAEAAQPSEVRDDQLIVSADGELVGKQCAATDVAARLAARLATRLAPRLATRACCCCSSSSTADGCADGSTSCARLGGAPVRRSPPLVAAAAAADEVSSPTGRNSKNIPPGTRQKAVSPSSFGSSAVWPGSMQADAHQTFRRGKERRDHRHAHALIAAQPGGIRLERTGTIRVEESEIWPEPTSQPRPWAAITSTATSSSTSSFFTIRTTSSSITVASFAGLDMAGPMRQRSTHLARTCRVRTSQLIVESSELRGLQTARDALIENHAGLEIVGKPEPVPMDQAHEARGQRDEVGLH